MPKPIILPDDDIRPLCIAIVTRAIADLRHKKLSRRLDALLWLTSEDFEEFALVAGIEGANPYEILPRLGEVEKLFIKRRHHNGRQF
jgi:hypothetical protein